jgi:uncharacterized metal-binding protein YceD (DUF177 family)
VRIVVENLPANGRTIAFELADAWAREAATTALEAPPTALSGTLEIAPPVAKGRIEVVARVTATAEHTCGRCTEPVVLAVDAEVPLTYVPAGEAAAEEDEPLSEDELDIGWYAAGELDLAQVVGEALALQLPARIACADVAACDARTDALLAAQAAKLPPSTSGFAALSSRRGASPSRSTK